MSSDVALRTAGTPRQPLPRPVRRALRRVLPAHVYRRYVARHDDESLRVWRHLAALVEDGCAILDVGAFQGKYAFAARAVSRTAVTIHALEPNPESEQELRARAEGSGINVERLALSDRTGTALFNCRSATSSLVDADPSAEGVLVECTTLDAWAEHHGLAPTLIKLDVEGHEAAVLAGGSETLKRLQPWVLCEVLSDDAGRAVMASLPGGYLYYHVLENRGVLRKETVTRRTWRNVNWLLVPGLKSSAISAYDRLLG